MSKNVKTLSEAIEQLESAGKSTAQEFKTVLEKDFSEVKKALENLKPHLIDLQDSLQSEVGKRKSQAEKQLKQNPWMVVGIVALFALVLGLFFGTQTGKSSDKTEE